MAGIAEAEYILFKSLSKIKIHWNAMQCNGFCHATTFIIGNGIGMALNSEYFALEQGLNSSWQSFNDKEKNSVSFKSVLLNNGKS